MLEKDLVADILPPPAYLLEAYLEASLAMAAQLESAAKPDARAEIPSHIEALKKLEQDYETRHQYWRQQDLTTEVKTAFLKESFESGERFWRIINNSFVPALQKGDSAEAQHQYKDLSAEYQQHRKAIDQTVELANKENDAIVADAAQQKTIALAVTWTVGLFVLFLVTGGIAGVLLAILRPMNRINQVMGELATGHNQVHIPFTENKTEIGEMARAVDVFRTNAIAREGLEAEAARKREKELEHQRHLEDSLLAFRGSITKSTQILGEEVAGLRETSDNLLEAASRASEQANASQIACNTAASGSEAVAAATEQLNASIREIATQAHSTSSIVGEATEKARNTDGEVSNLMDAVSKIETVVTLIRKIAQHTNLLALNATIESARAGEAGRGFAVVASEVKGLSEQTAKATEDIARQIHSVQATTGTAAAAVREIGTQVSDIHHLATSVAAAVEQQQAATADIARNVSIVANGSTQAAESARIVTEVAEHTGAEARRLSEASNQLQAVSADVSKAVQDFIGAVSANLEDRRAALRQKVEKVLVVSAHGQRQEAQTIDVSTTGMKIKNVHGVSVGEAVDVLVGSQVFKAKVIWTEGSACGLKFDEAASIAQLADVGLIESVAKKAAA